jgi:hypothetical protein
MPNLSVWGEQLNIGTNGKRHELQVTALKNGTFVAVWSELGADYDIMAQIYNADGTTLIGPFQVNTSDTQAGTTIPSEQRLPDVAALADGGFAAAWVDHTNGPTGNDIRLRAFFSRTEQLRATISSQQPPSSMISHRLSSRPMVMASWFRPSATMAQQESA